MDETSGNKAEAKRQKMCHITVVFTCDTDEEALSVKSAISKALLPYPQTAVSTTIQERPVGSVTV